MEKDTESSPEFRMIWDVLLRRKSTFGGRGFNARKRKDNWWNKIFEKFKVCGIYRKGTRVMLRQEEGKLFL